MLEIDLEIDYIKNKDFKLNSDDKKILKYKCEMENINSYVKFNIIIINLNSSATELMKELKEISEIKNVLSNKDNTDKDIIYITPMKIVYDFFDYSKIRYEFLGVKKVINIETKEVIENNKNLAYCCFSYCWSVYKKMKDEDILNIMCKSASKIGFKYIWVDKYCINQNNKKEKQIEISKMGDYYKHANGVIIWLHDIENVEDDMNKI